MKNLTNKDSGTQKFIESSLSDLNVNTVKSPSI